MGFPTNMIDDAERKIKAPITPNTLKNITPQSNIQVTICIILSLAVTVWQDMIFFLHMFKINSILHNIKLVI